VLNKKTVNTLYAAMALNARFARRLSLLVKNYFYPDLPKWLPDFAVRYPLPSTGIWKSKTPEGRSESASTASNGGRRGKSLHDGFPDAANKTAIDLNRSGVP